MKTPSLTPICDFVARYRDQGGVRLHMPGHKGQGRWDVEGLDITEIEGADSLYQAHGIIQESEKIASDLWGAHTYYLTEGSSQAIRAMVHLAALYARQEGKKPLVLAGRNAHKAFVSAVAMTDVEVDWLWGEDYLRCPVTPDRLDERLRETDASAVYLTSPDYLGNTLDLAALAKVCHAHGTLLLVDNAHGAYLKWLSPSLHPIDLGADMCCDSAHKTLPALTGCAYLHLVYGVKDYLVAAVKDTLALYGSTSPSYLLLASLDALNGRIAEIAQGVRETARKAAALKGSLACRGLELVGDEPCKLTLAPKSWGYTGEEVATYLMERGIYPEFADPDYLVLMPSGNTTPAEWDKLQEALLTLPRLEPKAERPPKMSRPMRHIGIRQAVLCPHERIRVGQAKGRVLASVTVGCPPAVPILVSGEVVDEQSIAAMRYYGIEQVDVVK